MTNHCGDDYDRADEALELLVRCAIGEDDDSEAALAVVRAEDWSGYSDDVSIRLRPLYKLLDLCAKDWAVFSDLTLLEQRIATRLIRAGVLVPRTDNGEMQVILSADVASEFADPSGAGRDADDRRYDVSWLLGLFSREAASTTPTVPVAGPQLACDSPATAEKPKHQPTFWADIVSALGMKPDDRDKIKCLNERYSGPIPKPGKGKQPIVESEVLLEWWNQLAIRQ